MPTQRHYFVEQTPDGRYPVRGKGSIRATFIFDTRREAIDYIGKLNPDDRPDVERIWNVESGDRDQWRNKN